MNRAPAFVSAESWEAARSLVTFVPLQPSYTAGFDLQGLHIHVRDHKARELAAGDRTLEAHYGGFVLSQSRGPAAEVRRKALDVSYGREPQEALIAGREARIYELGPEPDPDDIDGRSPAVVVWHDGNLFLLVASSQMDSRELVRVALSIYVGR